MSVTFSQVAHRAHKIAIANGAAIRLGHVQQATAAILGYNSLAAYQAAVSTGVEVQNLEKGKYFFPDYRRMTKRIDALGLSGDDHDSILDALSESFNLLLPRLRMHGDERDLIDDVRGDLDIKIAESSAFSAAQNEANAFGFYDMMELEVLGTVVDIDDAEGSYAVEVEGSASFSYDEIERPMINRIIVKATVNFPMMGKRLPDSASFQVTDVEAAPDYY